MSQTTEALLAAGLTRAAVEDISDFHGEPAWLREARRSAFATFEALPMPTLKDEEWRRTDVRGLRLDSVVPFATPSPRVGSRAELPAEIRGDLAAGDQVAGLLVQQDCGSTFGSIEATWASQGVIFRDLPSAVREHGDLVQRYFGQAVPAGYNKFSALHTAFWSGGVFLYVPRGVEIAVPLQAITYLGTPGLSSFAHTLIVTEPDSEVTLVDQWFGPTGESPVLSSNVQEVFVGQNARVRYVTLQEWGRHVWNFSVNRSVLSRDATLNSLVVAFGGRFH
ncbi:MAG: SufD family Fe-S cluster assembly protein, partial [Chloroflexota bacterium]